MDSVLPSAKIGDAAVAVSRGWFSFIFILGLKTAPPHPPQRRLASRAPGCYLPLPSGKRTLLEVLVADFDAGLAVGALPPR